MEELYKIFNILKKVLPKLIYNPSIMEGCDVSSEEIDEIIRTRELPINVLEHISGDTFFEVYFDEFEITENEAREIALFLQKTARHYLEELQKEFPFIKE
ncbi:MAG TPA: hypothetical protein VMC80_03435 [Patescibacteria group bacterium]|nr:hypothetical protein [Patescibacteria group bacterium]